MTIGSILFGALLLQSPATQPTTMPATDAAALIAQLASDDLAVRDTAQAALRDIDEVAADLLKLARESCTDPDVQLRIDSLLVLYDEIAAVGASRITLKFKDAPLSEVLNAFARQSKATFSDPTQEFGNELPRVTIDVQGVSFWQALAALQTAGNLNILPQAENWRAMRNFGNPLFSSNAIESGAFLIQPMSANYVRSVGYTRNAGGGGENFSITLQLLTEPKIRLAQATGLFQLTRAIDSNGNNLLGPNSIQNFGVGVGQSQIHIATQMTYPKNPGETIAELSGNVRLNMARRVETIAIDDFSLTRKSIEKSIENARIIISGAEPDGVQPNWIAANFVVEAGGDQMMLQRLQMAIRQARIMDQKNLPFQQNTFNNISYNAQRAEFKVTYMPLGNPQMTPPYRLVLEVPTSFREVEVPFTLRDLKMP